MYICIHTHIYIHTIYLNNMCIHIYIEKNPHIFYKQRALYIPKTAPNILKYLIRHTRSRRSNTQIQIELQILRKEPQIFCKEPCIFLRSTRAAVCVPGTYILKTALHIPQRAFHILQRTLHIFCKDSYICSEKNPTYILQRTLNILKRTLHGPYIF